MKRKEGKNFIERNSGKKRKDNKRNKKSEKRREDKKVIEKIENSKTKKIGIELIKERIGESICIVVKIGQRENNRLEIKEKK